MGVSVRLREHDPSILPRLGKSAKHASALGAKRRGGAEESMNPAQIRRVVAFARLGDPRVKRWRSMWAKARGDPER